VKASNELLQSVICSLRDIHILCYSSCSMHRSLQSVNYR